MKKQQKLKKQFVSDIDKQLAEFNQTHPWSDKQLDEIYKYKRIYELRDNPTAERQQEKSIWDF